MDATDYDASQHRTDDVFCSALGPRMVNEGLGPQALRRSIAVAGRGTTVGLRSEGNLGATCYEYSKQAITLVRMWDHIVT